MALLSKEELLKQIETTLTKTKVVKLTALLQDQQFFLPDLIDLTFHEDKMRAFRSAWLLENLILLSPDGCIDDLHYVIEKFPLVKYESCMRHYAKIAMHLTGSNNKIIKNALIYIDLEPIVSKCFDWLIDPNVLVAVKVFAAQTLFNLKDRYQWIGGELKEQLIYLMRDGSAAMQSRGKKLLSKL
ncbi:hypothetical protein [Mucilaginibacter ginkgonis]|uniref:HEAT repeat protein n=1 Tax=Mucilaginibacter ginkgonis TaxID=2682091 RepID=A0A6I4IN06_9SPHI|nr:hypothetical protein [Mucilaginibacter ginkgonis]QQL51361.1 hypothetical protein GO620_007930 [Mucilaginibacter ginkgonis]